MHEYILHPILIALLMRFNYTVQTNYRLTLIPSVLNLFDNDIGVSDESAEAALP